MADYRDENSLYYNPKDIQGIVSQTGENTSAITNKTEVARTYQTQASGSFQQNMPQQALESLLGLIDQLQGKEVVNPIADRVAPLPIPKLYGGIESDYRSFYLDPLTHRQLTVAEGKALTEQRQRERAQYTTFEPGGTPETKFFQQERMNEIGRDRAQQEQYSKTAAITDAKNLTAYFQRAMLEEALPQITAAAEGAGTSKGSMRALQSQRAAEVTGEKAAALGAQLGVNYGQIWNQLAGTLEELTKIDPNSSSAHLLLQALQQAKGAIQSSSQVSTNQGTTTTQSSGVTQQVGNKSVVQDYDRGSPIEPLYSGLISEPQKQQAPQGGGFYSISYSQPEFDYPEAYSSWDPTNRSEVFEQEVTF